MQKFISASVGSYESGARNIFNDVWTIQELLALAARNLKNPLFDPNGIDGKIARLGSLSSTVTAITHFQRQQVGLRTPDQRIDVLGKTWKKLVQVSGRPPVAVAPITLTVCHGGTIPTNTNFRTATKATAEGMYESSFCLSGGLTGTFRGSIYPDDMTVKGRVLDGSYPLHLGFHKGGGAAKRTAADLVVRTQNIRAGLLVNARQSVPVDSDNPGKATSVGINVHNGFSSSRGSDGCLTLHPDDWSRFIQLFLDAFPNIADWHTLSNNTGKKIGTLIIQA